MSHPLEVAPCGECRSLVSRVAGCPHWKPAAAVARAIKARQTRERISREKGKPGPHTRRKAREAVEEFNRQMKIGAEPR